VLIDGIKSYYYAVKPPCFLPIELKNFIRGLKSIMVEYSEAEIIFDLSAGKEKALAAIHKLYYKELCSFCFMLTQNTLESQDIVSSLFEKLWLRCKELSFGTMNDVAGYLYVAARHMSLNCLRSERLKSLKHKDILAETKDTFDTLNDQLDVEYVKALRNLKETIYNLPQRSIRVLQMIYFEDKSYNEIAHEMDISQNTVSNLRRQGISILARILNLNDFIVQGCIVLLLALSGL